jgi:hypothetical protein
MDKIMKAEISKHDVTSVEDDINTITAGLRLCSELIGGDQIINGDSRGVNVLLTQIALFNEGLIQAIKAKKCSAVFLHQVRDIVNVKGVEGLCFKLYNPALKASRDLQYAINGLLSAKLRFATGIKQVEAIYNEVYAVLRKDLLLLESIIRTLPSTPETVLGGNNATPTNTLCSTGSVADDTRAAI